MQIFVKWKNHKKSAEWRFFYGWQVVDKPGSVLGLHQVGIINLRQCVTTKRQALYPFSHRRDCQENLFEVAAHRDCPFHSNLIVSSLLLWSSGRPARMLTAMLSHCSPDFPLTYFHMPAMPLTICHMANIARFCRNSMFYMEN